MDYKTTACGLVIGDMTLSWLDYRLAAKLDKWSASWVYQGTLAARTQKILERSIKAMDTCIYASTYYTMIRNTIASQLESNEIHFLRKLQCQTANNSVSSCRFCNTREWRASGNNRSSIDNWGDKFGVQRVAGYPSLILGLGSVTAGPSSHILAGH